MFVINVPKSAFFEYSQDIRKLKNYKCVAAISDRPAYVTHELSNRADMFQRMPAAYDICFYMSICGPIKILYKFDLKMCIGIALRYIRRINADSGVAAQFAHERQEFSLAAANLQNCFILDMILIDKPLRKCPAKELKHCENPCVSS